MELGHEAVEEICRNHGPVITVKPLKPHAIGVVTSGSEVYHGRIEDEFGPVLHRKFNALGSRILRQIIVDDDMSMIAGAIRELIAEEADFYRHHRRHVRGPRRRDPRRHQSCRRSGLKVIYGLNAKSITGKSSTPGPRKHNA